MVFARKSINFAEILVFIYLVLFPFGQLIRFNVSLFGVTVPLIPTDLVIGAVLLFFLTNKFEIPAFFRQVKNFFWACLFSLAFSLVLFRTPLTFFGGLYLVRFFGYLLFAVVINNIARTKSKKELLFNSLALVSIITALFGWLQYFIYPDFRPLTVWGWDDHLYRLIGTFLDPTFTGIILVFGFLICFIKFERKKSFRYLGLAVFLLISLAFTYSRASYAALLGGLFAYFSLKTKIQVPIIVSALFLLIVLALPRPSSEGVQLERVKSIYSRLTNYSQTLAIVKKTPVFGVGFNNICLARQTFLGDIDIRSHSCSGSDSSLLLVLATTGVVGFLIFIRMLVAIIRSLEMNIFGQTFLAAAAAVFIHSAFSNSLFYPWVLGYLGILAAISLKE